MISYCKVTERIKFKLDKLEELPIKLEHLLEDIVGESSPRGSNPTAEDKLTPNLSLVLRNSPKRIEVVIKQIEELITKIRLELF